MDRPKRTAGGARKAQWESGPRWPDPHAGPWQILFEWTQLESGRKPCTGVRLSWVGEGEPEEISSSFMRAVPIGTLIAGQRRKQAMLAAGLDAVSRRKGAPMVWITQSEILAAEERLVGRPGRTGRPKTREIDFYVAIAEIYKDAFQRGANPTLAITEADKRLGVKLSRSGAAKAVAKTRSLRLLPPTERGKARA